MTDHEQMATEFEAAADILDANGWCQGEYQSGESHCAIGALSQAIYGNSLQMTLPSHRDLIMADVLASFVSDDRPIHASIGRIMLFNDDSDRTQGEVTDLFRTAAKELRG